MNPAREVNCFWPAVRAVSQALRMGQAAAVQPGIAETAGGTSDWQDLVASTVAHVSAVVTIRRLFLEDDIRPVRAEDGEQLQAAVVAMRADSRLAQQLRRQAWSSADRSAAQRPAIPADGLATGAAAALAAAHDASMLLERRAAAALTQFLIDEPAIEAGSDLSAEHAGTLWLTLHGAIAHLHLQGACALLSPPCELFVDPSGVCRGQEVDVCVDFHCIALATCLPSSLCETLALV